MQAGDKTRRRDAGGCLGLLYCILCVGRYLCYLHLTKGFPMILFLARDGSGHTSYRQRRRGRPEWEDDKLGTPDHKKGSQDKTKRQRRVGGDHGDEWHCQANQIWGGRGHAHRFRSDRHLRRQWTGGCHCSGSIIIKDPSKSSQVLWYCTALHCSTV